MDPFYAEKTLCLHNSIVEPDTGEPYSRDPRGTAEKAEREYETALAIERGENDAGIKHSYCPLRARDFTKSTVLEFQDRFVRNVYCLLRDCPSSPPTQGSHNSTRKLHPPGTYLSPCRRGFTPVHATNPHEW